MSTSSPVLEFIYLKNRAVDLGDGQQYAIPCITKPKENAPESHGMLVPVYDYGETAYSGPGGKHFKVVLADETPQIPVKPPGMSERMHSELADEAYKDAFAARKANETIRARIAAYVRSGTIQVVSDPFQRETRPDSDENDGVKRPPSQSKAAVEAATKSKTE